MASPVLRRALVAALVLSLGGCTNITKKLGDVNNSLTSISGSFQSAISNQQTVINEQKQILTQIQETNTTLKEKDRQIDRKLQKHATAVVDLLDKVDKAATPQGDVALTQAKKFSEVLQTELGGAYLEADRIDAAKIASGAITPAQVDNLIRVDFQEYTKLLEAKAKLEGTAATLQGRLDAAGNQLQQTHDEIGAAKGQIDDLRRRITWERFVGWIKTPAGIIACVALLVAFPALIPLLGALIGNIVSMFPALMSYFGLASKSTVDRVAQGVGNFKDELDKAAAKGAVTADQVRALLKRELLAATDEKDRRVINHIRTTRNIS